MNETETQIVAWLRDMARLAPGSGHGMQGYLAAEMRRRVADGIERGDHRQHAALCSRGREAVRQAGPARSETLA